MEFHHLLHDDSTAAARTAVGQAQQSVDQAEATARATTCAEHGLGAALRADAATYAAAEDLKAARWFLHRAQGGDAA